MWARKRIDIRWIDLLFGAWWSVLLNNQAKQQLELELEKEFSTEANTLVCLSVRSGFDLLLNQIGLPRGSEVLISAVTIQDIPRILEHHGLVPVPVDLDAKTMAPTAQSLRSAITSRTKAILIAHLFGGIVDFNPYVEIAAEFDLLLIEDCAQAFDGDRYAGHLKSDIVMFSFGPIKTATALGGGLLVVRDEDLLQRMASKQMTYPVQSRWFFLKRVLIYSLLKLTGSRFGFGCLVQVCRLIGKDYESLLNGAVRNFPADQFFNTLRQQPSAPLCRLMKRRIRTFDLPRQNRRADSGRFLSELLGPHFRCPGSRQTRHTYWIFPLAVEAESGIVSRLREIGFDAATASQLRTIESSNSQENQAIQRTENCLSRVIYLPLYPEIPRSELKRMAEAILNEN